VNSPDLRVLARCAVAEHPLPNPVSFFRTDGGNVADKYDKWKPTMEDAESTSIVEAVEKLQKMIADGHFDAHYEPQPLIISKALYDQLMEAIKKGLI